MSTYTKADEGTHKLIYRVMEQFHSEQRDAKVTVQCVMAHPPTDEYGESTGPAIKVRGHAAAARIRVTTLKQRALGAADLEIEIDADNWEILSRDEAVALLDHELTHCDLKVGDSGVLRDDLDRPRFTTRYHDREFGWFDCVAGRHGASAPEIRQLSQFMDSSAYRQQYLPGMTPVEA